MKRLIYIMATGIILTSCGADKQKTVDDLISEGNLTELLSKRKELSDQQQSTTTKIQQLDSVIGSLQGTKNLPLVTTVVAKPSARVTLPNILQNIILPQ